MSHPDYSQQDFSRREVFKLKDTSQKSLHIELDGILNYGAASVLRSQYIEGFEQSDLDILFPKEAMPQFLEVGSEKYFGWVRSEELQASIISALKNNPSLMFVLPTIPDIRSLHRDEQTQMDPLFQGEPNPNEDEENRRVAIEREKQQNKIKIFTELVGFEGQASYEDFSHASALIELMAKRIKEATEFTSHLARAARMIQFLIPDLANKLKDIFDKQIIPVKLSGRMGFFEAFPAKSELLQAEGTQTLYAIGVNKELKIASKTLVMFQILAKTLFWEELQVQNSKEANDPSLNLAEIVTNALSIFTQDEALDLLLLENQSGGVPDEELKGIKERRGLERQKSIQRKKGIQNKGNLEQIGVDESIYIVDQMHQNGWTTRTLPEFIAVIREMGSGTDMKNIEFSTDENSEYQKFLKAISEFKRPITGLPPDIAIFLN